MTENPLTPADRRDIHRNRRKLSPDCLEEEIQAGAVVEAEGEAKREIEIHLRTDRSYKHFNLFWKD
jgi:hypothetical protein